MKTILACLIAGAIWASLTLPALAQSPPINVTIPLTTTDFIFTAPRGQAGNYLVIMDGQGRQVFTRTQTAGLFDFKAQAGVLTYYDADKQYFEILDQSYQLIDTWKAVGFARTDNHDLQLLPNGNALLLAYKAHTVDLSAFGGHVTATVISCVIQEIAPDKSLAWEWDSFDHNPISDTNRPLTTPTVDYDHCNAVAPDDDGNILYSSRHLDQITKINRQTGVVLWKLGGKSNEFAFVNDPGFSLQHDIRRIANGNITLFDNGQASRGYSRAVEYEIDEVGKVITRTWEYRGPFAGCCGNAQKIETGEGAGNFFINFGPGHPTMREVTPAGAVVFEADTPFSYRSFRLPWRTRWYLPIITK